MAHSDAQEPISNLSDSSFVILGQGSLPSQINEELNHKSDSGSDFLTKTKSTCSILDPTSGEKCQNKWLDGNESFEEDIQKKFEELIKENYQLKETLSQNNLAIKSQLDTFFMWQQEVLKTHETHKQKFLETKDLILKLRGENASLKKQLDSLPGVAIVSNDDIYSEVNKKPEELNKLKGKIKEYEIVCTELTVKNEDLETENQKMREELKALKNEILKLNNEIEDIGRENLYLKQKNINVNKNSLENVSPESLPNAEARAQISNLLRQLEEEKGKTLKLKEELKKNKTKNGESSCLKLSTIEQLNQYIDKINDMNTSLDMQNQRFSSLQSWVSLAEENLKDNKVSEGVECNLMYEIKELKSHLNQEENVFKEKQESLKELNKQFNKLLEDYKSLQLQLSSIKNNETSIEKYKDFSSLSAKLEERDRELLAKQQECDYLKEDVKKLKLECEEVAVLRVQLQLYQSDFNDERAAREKLVGEKEQMAEQIRLLQSKIEALHHDNAKKTDSPASPLESSGRKSKYVCPKCMFTFSDLSRCEKHVDECLDIHFYP